MKNPESVVYAPKQNLLFASNINGKPDQKDQNGFISTVSPSNGSIVELNWITGLNAPKGMAVNNNNSRLYVSDITDLVEIDIDGEKIVKRFNAPGSAFLNDVAVDNQGNIYVSDTVTNTIYKLDRDANNSNISTLQAWLQSPQLNGPNGLHVDNSKNRLIVASLGEMSKPGAGIEVVDLKNKSISSLGKEGSTSPFGGLDGIESDATETHYYVTDNPAGRLYDVNANGSEVLNFDRVRYTRDCWPRIYTKPKYYDNTCYAGQQTCSIQISSIEAYELVATCGLFILMLYS